MIQYKNYRAILSPNVLLYYRLQLLGSTCISRDHTEQNYRYGETSGLLFIKALWINLAKSFQLCMTLHLHFLDRNELKSSHSLRRLDDPLSITEICATDS